MNEKKQSTDEKEVKDMAVMTKPSRGVFTIEPNKLAEFDRQTLSKEKLNYIKERIKKYEECKKKRNK